MSMDFKDHVHEILEKLDEFPEEMRPAMKLAAHAAEVAYCAALVEVVKNRQAKNMQAIQCMVMEKCANQVAKEVCHFNASTPDGPLDLYVRVATLAENTARESCKRLRMAGEESDAIN